MKLYATVSSERASKGQGGKELKIEVMGENKKTFLSLLILPPDNFMRHPIVSIEGATYEVARQLLDDAVHIQNDVLAGKRTKGKQQKGECDCYLGSVGKGHDMDCNSRK